MLQAGPEAVPGGESEEERLQVLVYLGVGCTVLYYTVLYCTVLYCTVQVLVYVGVGAVLVGLAVTGVGAPPARQHWPLELEAKVIRRFPEILQSWRRPLLVDVKLLGH